MCSTTNERERERERERESAKEREKIISFFEAIKAATGRQADAGYKCL